MSNEPILDLKAIYNTLVNVFPGVDDYLNRFEESKIGSRGFSAELFFFDVLHYVYYQGLKAGGLEDLNV